ncbi:MAG: hypothetical protein FWC70_00975 [Defluviitaleaceae bacterium]|nr:hypothetical protein [Defluviitaleaceae bacterium]
MKKYILPLLVFAALILTGCGRQRPCEPFPEPVRGYVYCPLGVNRWPYLQVGWRHFHLSYPGFDEIFSGSVDMAIEGNGMIAVTGHIYGNDGWVFWREFEPLRYFYANWTFATETPTEECIVELQRAREAFIAAYGNVSYINVYDFDGVTVIDTWRRFI